MPIHSSDLPGPEFVEKATAAPGEKRAVKPPKRKRKRKSKRVRNGE